MTPFKPVSIPNAAYIFCRFTIAILFVFGFFLRMETLILTGFLILLLSAILKVRRAPLIWIYTQTLERVHPSRKQIIDEKGIRFAHGFGALLSGISLILISAGFEMMGWALALLLAILQTMAAFGFCSAYKLYTCVNSGGDCCNIGKRVRKMKHV
jgi:hypothetical protein